MVAMSLESAAKAEAAARRYYGTGDVDAFYAVVWGGEDIHTGVYAHEHESVALASRRTVELAAGKVADRLGPGSTVLDLGSGYGGPTRYLAGRFGCKVVALNISESQNERHRRANAEQGMDGLIEVVTGSFQDIPYPAGYFDVVWSQEAFCHSGDRNQLLGEAVRVLEPRGDLVFTDLMAADTAPPDALRAAVARLDVDGFATPGFYRRTRPDPHRLRRPQRPDTHPLPPPHRGDRPTREGTRRRHQPRLRAGPPAEPPTLGGSLPEGPHELGNLPLPPPLRAAARPAEAPDGTGCSARRRPRRRRRRGEAFGAGAEVAGHVGAAAGPCRRVHESGSCSFMITPCGTWRSDERPVGPA